MESIEWSTSQTLGLTLSLVVLSLTAFSWLRYPRQSAVFLWWLDHELAFHS